MCGVDGLHRDSTHKIFLGMLFGTLGNMLTWKGIFRASYGNKKGKGILKAGHGSKKCV